MGRYHAVDWRTGEPKAGRWGHYSHCSAFVAAFADQLGFYILRPPQHSQVLLATAQVAWLESGEARQKGWHKITGTKLAQSLANQGQLVVAAFPNPKPKKAGHIAIVHPADISERELAANGPRITQAGEKNYLLTTVREGFKNHPGAWPDGVSYYAHE